MFEPVKDLYMFNTYVEAIDLSFNQFLLSTEEPILFHTGDIVQARSILPKIEGILGSRDLKYIFVSHFESDECGGINLILERYPNAITICSEVTGRQFRGFGYENQLLIKKPGESLVTEDYSLEFISYPSEMHLWEGLFAFESIRKVFFSADIMVRRGSIKDPLLASTWEKEIEEIKDFQISNPSKLEDVQRDLKTIEPDYVAPGHGNFLVVK